MRVALFEPKADDATSFYRSRGAWHYLSKHHPLLQFIIPQGSGWIDAVLYDVAVFQRPCNATDAKAMLMFKECGVKVIADYDDDLLNVADHNPSFLHHTRNKQFGIDCLRIADTVIVSTDKLKESYSAYNKNIVVIPNALNDYFFTKENKNPFVYNKIAYYRGGSSHQRDVYGYKDEIIKTIKKNPDWKFYFIGDRFQFIEAETLECENFFVSGYAPTFNFLQNTNALHPCVNFVFLENSPFNQAKSNCAWIEATYAGAASIAPLKLAEFDKVPSLAIFTMHQMYSESKLKESHDKSWQYIQDHLLLSEVNKLRLQVLH